MRSLRLHPDPHRDTQNRSAVLHLGRPVGLGLLLRDLLFRSLGPRYRRDDELDDLLPSVLATGGGGELDREGEMIDR